MNIILVFHYLIHMYTDISIILFTVFPQLTTAIVINCNTIYIWKGNSNIYVSDKRFIGKQPP